MTNNKLTDDLLAYVLAVVEDRYDNRTSNAGEDDRIIIALRELQERRKADAEPVFFINVEGDDWIQAGRIPGSEFDFNNLPDGINLLYANPPVVNCEPIYQVQYDNDWRDVERAQYDDHAAHGSPVRVVYTALPAPVVPEEMTPQQASRSYGGEVRGYREGWNACRAAMLQGSQPVSNRDELPDGWIKCSERMPEDEQEVLTINGMGHRFVSFFDEHSGLFFDRLDVAGAFCTEHILVTHWMPLPAAPQQEAE